MLDKIFKKLFGDKDQKDLKELLPIVDLVNIEYEKIASISDNELRNKTTDFKSSIQKHNSEIISAIFQKLNQDGTPKDNGTYEEIYQGNDYTADNYRIGESAYGL